jgi:hypothetical protein
MWRLNLDPKSSNPQNPAEQPKTSETINIIFDLPSSHKTFLWYHALVGLPPKVTFINTNCNCNYATWPKLTVTLISCYFLDMDKTVKRHLKGQCQGIHSTKQKALDKIIENKLINYLLNYPNLHIVQLEQTEVFLIAVSYHSKTTMGQLVQAPEVLDSFGLRLLRC